MTPSSLLAWRLRMDWTQRQAAQALGMTSRAYGAIERGERSSRWSPRMVELATRCLECPQCGREERERRRA